MQKFVQESWLVVSLGGAFAVLLASMQVALRPTIIANENAVLEAAIAQVIPNYAERVQSVRKWLNREELVDGKAFRNDVFQCLGSDDETAGWAIVGSGPGFVDRIVIVVGITADKSTITGIKVIRSVETPGLGDKILSGPFPEQFVDRPAEPPITVSKTDVNLEQNVLQAITGATYSSEYVADIVNDIMQRVVPQLDALSPDDATTTTTAQEG